MNSENASFQNYNGTTTESHPLQQIQRKSSSTQQPEPHMKLAKNTNTAGTQSPRSPRPQDNSRSVMLMLKKIKFFQDMEIKPEDFTEICQRLRYEFFRQGQVVFAIGDYGDKFYIILQGSVGVLIPNQKRRRTVDRHFSIHKRMSETQKQINQVLNQQKQTIHEILDSSERSSTNLNEKKTTENANTPKRENQEATVQKKEENKDQEGGYEEDENFSNSENGYSDIEEEEDDYLQDKDNEDKNNIDKVQITIENMDNPQQNSNDSTKSLPKDNQQEKKDYQYSTFRNQNATFQLKPIQLQSQKSFSNSTNSKREGETKNNATFLRANSKVESKNGKWQQQPQFTTQQTLPAVEQHIGTYYREVVVLSKGASFGELALIQLKPRAATIICKEDCYFAVLDRQSYDKVLKKIQQNQLNANIKFLQSIPFFSKWTKNSVAKFSYFFEKKYYQRNQIIYKEGEQCTHVYLVIKGEFEVKKRVRNQSTQLQKFDMMEFLPQIKNKMYEGNVKNGRFINAVNNFKSKKAVETMQNIRIMIIGVGNVIGEEDAVKDRHYSTSVYCFSQSGEVYAISIDNFHKFIKTTDMETWYMLEKNALQKELNVLKIMESKYKLEEESQLLKADFPNKYVDEELLYMKEIRETYFMPKPEDLIEVKKEPINKQKFEITDQTIKQRESSVPLTSTIKDTSPLMNKESSIFQKNLMQQKKTIEFSSNLFNLNLQKVAKSSLAGPQHYLEEMSQTTLSLHQPKISRDLNMSQPEISQRNIFDSPYTEKKTITGSNKDTRTFYTQSVIQNKQILGLQQKSQGQLYVKQAFQFKVPGKQSTSSSSAQTTLLHMLKNNYTNETTISSQKIPINYQTRNVNLIQKLNSTEENIKSNQINSSSVDSIGMSKQAKKINHMNSLPLKQLHLRKLTKKQ